MIGIRRATPTDVADIGSVIRDVWGQEILPEVCLVQIADAPGALWVAEERGHVAGFASAFATLSAANQRRWEIDLVAVRPSYEGRGAGHRLIKRASRDGAQRGVAVVRALVRVSNLPSQRAFRKAGFTTDHRRYHLLLWSPKSAQIRTPSLDGVSLVPVDSLTYRGLWIEGLEHAAAREQHAVVAAARATIARDGRLNAGALVEAEREYLLAADLRAQAEMRGEYYWFVKPASVARMEG